MITIQDAVDDLYRIAVIEGKRTATNRLALLADMCIERLAVRGIAGATREVSVPGIVRSKDWDVAWPSQGKVRLGISLKSILSNPGGTSPNRADDLMGEMANVQLRSPEIVTGYLMVFNSTGNGHRKDGTRWVDFFRDSLLRLAGRDAPAWAVGMVEAAEVVEVDFRNSAQLVKVPNLDEFFDRLANCVKERNPDMFDF